MLIDCELYCLRQILFLKCSNNAVNRSSSTEKHECWRSHHAMFGGELRVFGVIYYIEFSEMQFVSIFCSQLVINWFNCLTTLTVWMPGLYYNQLLCFQNYSFPICSLYLFYPLKQPKAP